MARDREQMTAAVTKALSLHVGEGFWEDGWGGRVVVPDIVDAIEALPDPELEITGEMVQCGVEGWILAPGDLVHERMRAALEAALFGSLGQERG